MRGAKGGVAPATLTAGNALLASLAMAQFMVVLDFTIINVALPSIEHGLHVANDTAVVGDCLHRYFRRSCRPTVDRELRWSISGPG